MSDTLSSDQVAKFHAVSYEQPSLDELRYLVKGVKQPDGKLPLFDDNGQAFKFNMVQSCLKKGWVEPWFANPIKPDWLVCRLTNQGRVILGRTKALG